MDFLKKLDIKTWFIIILGIALIISFFFGQGSKTDLHKDEIKVLHESNTALLKSNDSLKVVNSILDAKIISINKILNIDAKVLSDTQSELNELKKRKNEIPIYVNHLSANGVSNAFSDYLKNRTKSTNTH
jgi:hypothetical protein